jgi:predicted DNA-binding transcriptional regulator AlpA
VRPDERSPRAPISRPLDGYFCAGRTRPQRTHFVVATTGAGQDLACPTGPNAGFETKRQFPQLSSLESGSGQSLRPAFGGLHPGEHHSNRTHSQRREKTDLPQAPKPEAFEFIPGPKFRAKLGISAVTLWRWRHDKEKGFPAPKVINGRLYFALGAVVAWLARQADAA